ncbi:MAG: hypothetical protein IIB28_03935 [Chloroflexi bacterium]|nr:hypothetical protein [Chloroflexota bacterium]
MTERERQIAILEGRSPDRIPWIPRMEIWYTAHRLAGTLPPEYQELRLSDIQKDLGIGASARTGRVYTKRLRGVDVVTRLDGMFSTTEYRTPVGMVSETFQRTVDLDKAGIQGLMMKKLIKRPEDYETVMYICENTEYYPAYEEFEAYDRDIGDRGLPMVAIEDVPFHDWLGNLTGYDKGYYDLMDFPDKVERLLETMTQVYKERLWPVVGNSSARLILHGAHFATQTTPASFYDQYMTSYIREFTDYMHEHGKSVTQHADNDTSGIMDQLLASGYDMQECFVTAPMVEATIEMAREKWGDKMIIFGGVPSVMLEEDVSDADFEQYMENLFKAIAPGDAFFLGVSDNVMPSSMLSRIRRITEMVEEMGKYPIAA